jgi:hypothetical protein
VIAAVIAALTLSAAPAGAVKHHDGCHPRRARTVAHNATLRVFWVRHTLYACKKGGTRPIYLGEPAVPCSEQSSTSGCDGVSAVRVKRRFVAVAWFAEGERTIAWVDVVDVVKRRHVSSWEPPDHDGPYWFTNITDMVLASSGALGMIVQEGRADPEDYQVTDKVLTLNGSKRTLLDTGDDIDDHSLALRNGTLYWKHGDIVRSAPLQ